MRLLKSALVLALGALAACAFGSYTALIPPEDVVLPLGTFTVGGAYVQSSDDPTRWDPSTDNGVPEEYEIRHQDYGYWLNEEAWLVFAPLEGGSDEYLMQIASPEESIAGGYVYNYAIGKLVGNRLFMKLPDCDDLPIDTMNDLALDADCAIASYDDLKRVIAETKDEVTYSTYYELR